jgi:hypothetical protein
MTMVISHFWLKEPMPISKILGAVLIISGNVISLGGRFKRQSKMIGFYNTNCGEKMKKQLSMPTLIGFDDVGRSISKKDKVESTPKETAPVKKDAA